jgi:ankyrin repeat protein
MESRSVATITAELFKVIKDKQNEKIIPLIKEGADLSAVEDGKTPVELAAKINETAVALIAKTPCDKNDTYKFGSVLLEFVKKENVSRAESLINAGAWLTWRRISSGNTSLHIAAQNGNMRILQLLIHHNADQCSLNHDNKTPVELASESGNWEVVRFLVKSEQHPEKERIKELHWKNVLQNAIKQDNYAMVKFMLEHGASCKSKNDEMGNIALGLAVKHSHNPMIFSLLLEYGANPNVENKDGKNTYALAEDFKNTATLRLLKPDVEHQWLQIEYQQNTDKLFQDICEYAIDSEKLPQAILYLGKCHRTIFQKELKILQQRRTDLEKTAPENISLRNISAHILAINKILRVGSKDLNLDFLQNNDSPEAQHFVAYLKQKESVDAYKERVINYLADLVYKIENDEKWKTYFFGFWIDGTPDHVGKMLAQAKNITDARTLDEVLAIYSEVIGILKKINHSSIRHDNTTRFYKDQKSTVRQFSFLSNPKKVTSPIEASNPLSLMQIVQMPVYPIPQFYVPPPIIEISPPDKITAENSTPVSRLYPSLTSIVADEKMLQTKDFQRVPELSLLSGMFPRVPNKEIRLDDEIQLDDLESGVRVRISN